MHEGKGGEGGRGRREKGVKRWEKGGPKGVRETREGTRRAIGGGKEREAEGNGERGEEEVE